MLSGYATAFTSGSNVLQHLAKHKHMQAECVKVYTASKQHHKTRINSDACRRVHIYTKHNQTNRVLPCHACAFSGPV